MCVAGTAIFLPLGVPELLRTPAAAWSPQVVVAALSVVVGGTILGNLAWNYAVQQIGATRTAVYTYLQPVVGVLIAVVALGERPSLVQVLGGAVILLGLLAYPRPRTNAGDPDLSVEIGSPAPKDVL
jgi:O-acetylserine/cysteine efflux transporter